MKKWRYLIAIDLIHITQYGRAFQPAAHGLHAVRMAILCGPRSQMIKYICSINEIMKPEHYTILQSFGSINSLSFLIWWSWKVKILQKIYKTPLILLHAARLMTRLTGVRPAIDLGWKALQYGVPLYRILFVGMHKSTLTFSAQSWFSKLQQQFMLTNSIHPPKHYKMLQMAWIPMTEQPSLSVSCWLTLKPTKRVRQ